MTTDARQAYDATRPIVRRDDAKRLVTCAVFEPGRVDTYGTHVERDEIERVAHRFMIKLVANAAAVGLQHEEIARDVHVVESWVTRAAETYPGDVEIPAGSWMVTLYVANDEIWGAVQSGDLTGISFGGTGRVEDTGDEAA